MAKKIQKKEINLYTALQEALAQKKKSESKSHAKAIIIAVSIVVVIAVGAAYALLFMNKLSLQNQIDDIDKKLNNPEMAELMEKAEQESMKGDYLYEMGIALDKELSVLSAADKQLTCYTKDLFSRITALCPYGTKVMGASVETNTLILTVSSQNALDVPSYVEKLRNSGIVAQLSYTGFDSDEKSFGYAIECAITDGNPLLPFEVPENDNGGESDE